MPNESEGDSGTSPPVPPTPPSIPELAGKVFAVLEPLSSEVRQRVVASTLVMLGEENLFNSSRTRPNTHESDSRGTGATASREHPKTDAEIEALPVEAQRWVRKYSIATESLHAHFHFDGGKVTLFDSPLGDKSMKEQAVGVYLLSGIAALLETGQPAFSDEVARKLCEQFGCLHPANHARYIKETVGKWTGSKAEGWKLTHPGLAAAAELLKPSTGE